MTSPTQQDVYGTSAWQVGNSDLTRRFSAILAQYGLVPEQSTLDQYGLGSMFDPSQAAQARANPYSIFSQLGQSRDRGYGANQNTANSHNMLFSGAFKNSQDQVGRDYQQNVAGAGQEELNQLLGLGGDQSSLYQSIYGQLLNQPVAPDPTPTAGSDGSFVGGGTGGIGGIGYTGSGSAATGTSDYSPLLAPVKPKKGLTGITGGLGLGHVT